MLKSALFPFTPVNSIVCVAILSLDTQEELSSHAGPGQSLLLSPRVVKTFVHPKIQQLEVLRRSLTVPWASCSPQLHPPCRTPSFFPSSSFALQTSPSRAPQRPWPQPIAPSVLMLHRPRVNSHACVDLASSRPFRGQSRHHWHPEYHRRLVFDDERKD